MNEMLERLEFLNKTYDMSQWYCLTMWPSSNKIYLQGYYADVNFKIARDLDIKLELIGDMLRGENEYYRIALTT